MNYGGVGGCSTAEAAAAAAAAEEAAAAEWRRKEAEGKGPKTKSVCFERVII